MREAAGHKKITSMIQQTKKIASRLWHICSKRKIKKEKSSTRKKSLDKKQESKFKNKKDENL
jgi:hypothetical protein